MSDEIYFFTESYTHKPDAVATSSGGNDDTGHLPDDAVDYDMDSWWENDAALPVLKIDLGAVYAVDSLWFKHSNIDTFTLYYSADDIAYNAVVDGAAGSGGDAQWLFNFTERTVRYWRFNVTAKVGGGNALVYDLLLMEQRLAIEDPGDHPSDLKVIPSDRAGGSYIMANGSVASYSGERDYVDIAIGFRFTPKDNRDDLLALYNTDVDGNANLRTPLVIFPDSEYPEEIYRVLWRSLGFPLSYQIGYKLSGFGGTLRFQEY